MNTWLPYVCTALGSFAVGVAVGVFSNFINSRINRLHQFRKTIYVLVSEIEASYYKDAWAVLQRSKDIVGKEHAATAEDVHCWRRGSFENACIAYCNHQTINEIARQTTDNMFEGVSKDVDATILEMTDSDREREWAVNSLKRLIQLAKFFP
jgi:hypothetical protein